MKNVKKKQKKNPKKKQQNK